MVKLTSESLRRLIREEARHLTESGGQSADAVNDALRAYDSLARAIDFLKDRLAEDGHEDEVEHIENEVLGSLEPIGEELRAIAHNIGA